MYLPKKNISIYIANYKEKEWKQVTFFKVISDSFTRKGESANPDADAHETMV